MTSSLYGRLELTRVDNDCWRLCDGALPTTDPARIIAFAEKKDDGRVSVLWLQERSDPEEFSTFEDALRAAEEAVYDLDAERSERPLPIPHFPPLAG